MLQIYQIKYIIEVANCGSITAAAQKLYISQPGLTKLIHNFEEQYGFQLFTRTSRGVKLTKEGNNFIYHAKKLVHSSDELESILAEKRLEEKKILSVSSIHLDFLYEMVVKLYEYQNGQQLHFNLIEEDRSSVISSLLDHRANLGITTFSSNDPKSVFPHKDQLQVTDVATGGCSICVGSHSPLYDHESVSIEEVKNSPNCVLDIERPMRENLSHDPVQYAFNTNRIIFLNTIESCKIFLEQTDAVMYAPEWIYRSFNDTNIRVLPLSDLDHASNHLILAKRKGHSLSEIEQTFCQILCNYFDQTLPEEFC